VDLMPFTGEKGPEMKLLGHTKRGKGALNYFLAYSIPSLECMD
jgi:hypothetical protein